MKNKGKMNSVNNLFQASEGKKCGGKKSNLLTANEGQVQNHSVCICESISNKINMIFQSVSLFLFFGKERTLQSATQKKKKKVIDEGLYVYQSSSM